MVRLKKVADCYLYNKKYRDMLKTLEFQGLF